ncbi:MAG: hypothetical protein MZV64_17270 [Ignavibacteriales bacterium]|nr:hypothetical protein [Ignavibacteriales bacterium]
MPSSSVRTSHSASSRASSPSARGGWATTSPPSPTSPSPPNSRAKKDAGRRSRPCSRSWSSA